MHRSRGRVVLLSVVALVALVLAIALWISAPQPTGPDEVGAAHSAAQPAPAETVLEEKVRQVLRPPPTPAPEVDPVEAVVVAPSDRIVGRVLKQDGLPAPAGTSVIARRRGRVRVDPEIVARVLVGDPSISTARSAADGRFVLDGLEPGVDYLLCAAGGGYVGKTSDLEVRSGTTDAVIEVMQLYGVAVELREVGGDPLRSQADLAPPPARTFGRAEPYLDPSLLEFVGADLSRYRDAPGERLFLYTAKADPPMIRDVVLRFHPAGYEPIEVTLDVPPILPAIAERTLELKPLASGWGEIVVRFVDGADPTVGAPLIQVFQVALAPSQGDTLKLDLPRGPGEKRVRGVPFGRYELSVRNAIRQTFFPAPGDPPVRVEVGPTPVEIPVSLAGKAEVEIVFESGERQAYAGPATLSLTTGNPRLDLLKPLAFGGQVLFDRGPYLLRALLPGSYTLFLEDPAGTVAGTEANHAPLELAPGSSTKVRLILP